MCGSNIKEEKPVGWRSAHLSEGKKGGGKGKVLFVTPTSAVPFIILCSSTRWSQVLDKKHQKERGIVPTNAPSDMHMSKWLSCRRSHTANTHPTCRGISPKSHGQNITHGPGAISC
jgi:hypothetical protein